MPDEDNSKPDGNDPFTTEKIYGSVPPVAVNVTV
jgi:hypothetical protein